jgi:hypothetical protein
MILKSKRPKPDRRNDDGERPTARTICGIFIRATRARSDGDLMRLRDRIVAREEIAAAIR